jgi:hypothetical protein
MTTIELETALERLIDATNLAAVVFALDVIAGAKADHIATNWQDTTTAKVWNKAAHELAIVARKIEGLGI